MSILLAKNREVGSSSCSVVFYCLWPHGLEPTRLHCPWNSPGKNTRVGCHTLLQGLFLTQGLNLSVPHWTLDTDFFFFFLPFELPGEVTLKLWWYEGGLIGTVNKVLVGCRVTTADNIVFRASITTVFCFYVTTGVHRQMAIWRRLFIGLILDFWLRGRIQSAWRNCREAARGISTEPSFSSYSTFHLPFPPPFHPFPSTCLLGFLVGQT